MTEAPSHRSVRGYQGAMVALGVVTLGVLWSFAAPAVTGGTVILAAALGALVALGDRTELSFRFGGETLAATSATVPLLVVALYLPPAVAGVVALVAYLLVELRPGQLLHACYGASSSAVALVAASTLARGVAGGAPPPELALIAGVLAALAFEATYTGSGMLMLELRRRGAARAFLPDAIPVIVFDVVLGIVGVVIVAPFADDPWALVGVLFAFQLVAHAGLGMLNREQVQRGRALQLQRSFSRYVPAAVVRSMVDAGDDVELGGEAREVTVLFCDIRGFTSWAEAHAPADVVAELNDLLGELAQCVFATGGTLDKFTGDGLMAFWGAPLQQPDHASRALDAAEGFQVAISRLGQQRAANGQAPRAIGVGIHSGTAIVGNVGHAERHDYTAIGDTVNVAARLEAQSAVLGAPIVLSAETAAQLDDDRRASLTPWGDVPLKGRAEPVRVYLAGAVSLQRRDSSAA